MESRTILFSIKQKAKIAEEISRENKIPMSTVYKKLGRLENLALVKVDRIELFEYGHRIKYYKSRISEVESSIKKLEPKLTLYKN